MEDKKNKQTQWENHLNDASVMEHASSSPKHQLNTGSKKDDLMHKTVGIIKGGRRHYHRRGYQGL